MPVTVVGLFALAGGLIGADIAYFPWDNPVSPPIPIIIGLLIGFLAGVLIVRSIRQTEELT